MQVFVGSSCPSAHANFFYTSKQPFPESASVCHAHRFFSRYIHEIYQPRCMQNVLIVVS